MPRTKPNAFTKAAAADTQRPEPKPEPVVWTLPPYHALANDVVAFSRMHAQREALSNQMHEHEVKILDFAASQFVSHCAKTGNRPCAGISIATTGGTAVGVVVTERRTELKADKASGTTVEQAEAAIAAMIEPKLPREEILETERSISLDDATLAAARLDGQGPVGDWLGHQLANLLKKGVKQGVISQAQADAVVVVRVARKAKTGWLARVAHVFQGDRPTIAKLFAHFKPTLALKV